MSTTSTMSPSLTGHIMQRNTSSLSTESSEFEFDSCSFPELNDEPPLSPKLLYSPNYSPNYSPSGESTLMASTYNQFSAETHMQYASKAYYVEQQNFGDHLPYKAPPSVSRINDESAIYDELEKQRADLRSLLNRRDLEQLPPLTNYNIKSNHQIKNLDIKKQVPVKRSSPASTSSSSTSPSSSPINYRANHPTTPYKFEDNQGDISPPQSKICQQKKSRKWSFKLDFLRKGPSPRAEYQVLNQSSNDKQADYSPNHGVISNQPDHDSLAAVAEEAGFDDYLHERDKAGAGAAAGEGNIINNYELNQRIDHYREAAAAREARFNNQINQRIDNYRASAGVITKFESPRQSTSSVISSVSSSSRHEDDEMIRVNHRRISKSTPASPAGSPLHGGEGAFTRGQAPMSPHALYQEQRARTEGVRRKTFLPYRQSLLSACFFPNSPHHPPQAVH